MLAIVHLAVDAFDHPTALTVLAKIAAEHEVVLVCQHQIAATGLPALKEALVRRQLVALLVDGEVANYEQNLIRELLDEGRVPLIMTMRDPVPPDLVTWLDADLTVSLPADADPP